MKLRRLIKIASSAYPDDLILAWFDGNDDVGDTLAQILTQELQDSWDKNASTREHFETAIQVLHRIENEVRSVRTRLGQELKKHELKDPYA